MQKIVETAHVHELLHTMQKNLHCAIAFSAESKSLIAKKIEGMVYARFIVYSCADRNTLGH